MDTKSVFQQRRVIRRGFYSTHGSEGPRHDPYSYTEMSIFEEFDDGTKKDVTIHMGLAEWVEVEIDGDKLRTNMPYKSAVKTLKVHMGVTEKVLDKLEHYYWHGPDVCPHCRGPLVEDGGFVGETFLSCINEGCKAGVLWSAPVTEAMIQ